MSRRTLVLAAAAVLAVGAAVAVTVAGRASPSPRHDAVAEYILAVDRVQQRLSVPVTEARAAYESFASRGTVDASLRRRLERSERALRTLYRRLAAVPAPTAAARLRTLLLAYGRAQVKAGGEVTALAVFAPRFAVLARDLRRAGTRLSRALAAVPQPTDAATASEAAAAQADAIETYVGTARRLRRRLAALRPPAVLRPAVVARLHALDGSTRAGAALAQELRGPDRADVSTLSRRFTVAARSASSVRAQAAQIAAIRAYNRRVRSIGTLAARIRAETTRLQALRG